MKQDQRFTLNYEYCGYPQLRPVIRFCSEFVASCATHNEAQAQLETLRKAAEWVLVQSRNNVNLYAGNNGYRVAYGVHVTNHATYAAAASEFEACVKHEKEYHA